MGLRPRSVETDTTSSICKRAMGCLNAVLNFMTQSRKLAVQRQMRFRTVVLSSCG